MRDNKEYNLETLQDLYSLSLDTYNKERARTDTLDTKISVCLSLLMALLTASLSMIPFKAMIASLSSSTRPSFIVLTIGLALLLSYIVLVVLACWNFISGYQTKGYLSINDKTFSNEDSFHKSHEDFLAFYIKDFGESIKQNRSHNDDKATHFDRGIKLMVSAAFVYLLALLLLKIAVNI